MGKDGVGRIYGQEKNIIIYNLVWMNMLFYGVKDFEFEIYYGDFFINDWDIFMEMNLVKKIEFDVVLVNFFFSLCWKFMEILGEDFCFKNYGLVFKLVVDFVFFLYGFYYLRQEGIMVIILFYGVLFWSGVEVCIRKKFLKDNNIDMVIGLLFNLFFFMGIFVCVLVLKKCKKEDDVFFINVSEYYGKVKCQNYF